MLPLLSLLTFAPPALAQGEPFRVVNASRVQATELNVVRTGQADWGSNLLNRGPLEAGAQFALRAPVGSGCIFDLRLVVRSGQETVRREVDVCQERTVTMGAEIGATPPRPGTLPEIGGGERLLPQVPR